MSITSGLSPVRGYANGGMSEEEQFKDAMKEQGIAKLEEALGIRLPRGSEESEEALINNILGNVTDLPIQKRGDEYTYGDDDGFSFYVNPEEEGAGVRYNKRFADGGIAAYADGGGVEDNLDPYRLKEINQGFKDYIFDYTDPYEYATLPLYAAGPLGAVANKAIKAGRIANKASKAGKGYKPSGIENILGSKSVAYGVPAATIAGEVGYELATEEEELEDDALDQAKDDLNVVNANEKKDQSDPFFTQKEDGSFESTAPKPGKDKKLTKKERGIMAAFAALESFGDSQSQSSSTPGYMIEGMGAATPEITRYQEGGIANMDPMMMADGGIAKFAPGGAVIKNAIKEGIKKGIGVFNKAKKSVSKETEKVKKKRETSKKSKSPDRGYSDLLPPPVVGTASVIGKKLKEIGDVVYDYRKPLAAPVGIPSVVAGGIGISKLPIFKGEATETPEAKTKRLAKEAQDTLDAEYKERQEAREGLTSVADIHYARSLERAQEAGRTKPTFMDYLASFPASYGEKMSKDPEFAQQMMAGFAAMGKTTEGYVTRNAFTDFTQGAQEERIRQDEGTPDQLKMMRMLAAKPELADAYRKFNASTTPSDPTADLSQALSIEQAILGILYDGDPGKNDKVYDKAGNIVDKTVLLQIYREADGDYAEILKQVSKKSS